MTAEPALVKKSSFAVSDQKTTYRVFIGWDHAVLPSVFEPVLQFLKEHNHVSTVTDFGPHDPNNKVDYPDVAGDVCKRVTGMVSDGCTEALGPNEKRVGILICGSGIGMSIAANKYPGIRAALCHDFYTADMCRKHNNANVICAGARTTGLAVLTQMFDVFLTEAFTGNQHTKRVNKIDTLSFAAALKSSKASLGSNSSYLSNASCLAPEQGSGLLRFGNEEYSIDIRPVEEEEEKQEQEKKKEKEESKK